VAVRVIFPAFSRIQHDEREIARGYRDLCGYLARVVLPFTACLAVAAPEILRALYGPQWTPAAVPLRLLAGGLAISGLREGMGAVYYARNRPWIDACLNTVRLGFIVVAVISLAPAGLFGVSAGMSAIEAVTSVVGQYLACLLIGLKLRDLLVTMVPGLRLMTWCVMATVAGKLAASSAGLHGLLALALIAIPPALVFLTLERSEVNRMLAKSFDRNAAGAIEA
jgi:O-antigen/teichoic acid export membrane protein